MRKIIFILLLFAVFGLKKSIAQNTNIGINNASDLRVPVPGNINTTAPFIRVIVPAQPTMPTMPGVPAISPIPTLPSGGLMPSVPVRPAIPVGPNGASSGISVQGGTSSFTITGVLPNLPILPPLPPMAPSPQIKLPGN